MARSTRESEQEHLPSSGEPGTRMKSRRSRQGGRREAEPPAARGRHVTDDSNRPMIINSVCIDANNRTGAGHG